MSAKSQLRGAGLGRWSTRSRGFCGFMSVPPRLESHPTRPRWLTRANDPSQFSGVPPGVRRQGSHAPACASVPAFDPIPITCGSKPLARFSIRTAQQPRASEFDCPQNRTLRTVPAILENASTSCFPFNSRQSLTEATEHAIAPEQSLILRCSDARGRFPPAWAQIIQCRADARQVRTRVRICSRQSPVML